MSGFRFRPKPDSLRHVDSLPCAACDWCDGWDRTKRVAWRVWLAWLTALHAAAIWSLTS